MRKYTRRDPTAPLRWCSRCAKDLPLAAFTHRIRGRWLSSWCDACYVARTREWRAQNHADILAKRRASYPRVVVPPKPCDSCGAPFTPKSKAHRYCSRGCKRKRYQAYDPRRNAAHMATRRLRPRIIERWGRVCYLCGFEVTASSKGYGPEALTIDHVIPVSAGGTDDIENLRVAHRGCNMEKGDRLPAWWELRQAA